MAIFLVDNDIVEVRIVTNILEQIGINRRYYLVTQSTGLGRSDQEAATSLDALWHSVWKACMPIDAAWRGVSVQRVNPLPKTVAAVAVANVGNGTALGGLMAAQVSALVALKSDFTGRDKRGRAYIPFPSDNFITSGGKPSAGFLTTELDEVSDNLSQDLAFEGVDGNHLKPILWKPPTGPIVDIVKGIPRGEWATQRRRGGFAAKNTLPF